MRNSRNIIAAACAVCVFASGYVFGNRSELNLSEVREPLQIVARCALSHSPYDFTIVDGGRSEAEHRANVAAGRSWIKRSRHQDGAAIDFAVLVDNKITYDTQYYILVAQAFNYCSLKNNIPIVWGGEWKQKDYMHIELYRKVYP